MTSLHDAAGGGDSGFVDGFCAAAVITPVSFRLHARTGFASGGHWPLQGGYADLDGLESAVVARKRATARDTCGKDRT